MVYMAAQPAYHRWAEEFTPMLETVIAATAAAGAKLVMVDNPTHHPQGDFHLSAGRVDDDGEPRLTFGGIGVYSPALFDGCSDGAFPLAPLLRRAMSSRRVAGRHHRGSWVDVGTPQRLEQLDRMIASAAR